MKNAIKPLVIFLLFVVELTGCASKPARPVPVAPQARSGEEMLRESQGLAQLGERWLSGKKKVEAGESLVRQGQTMIQEGERQIEEGRRIMKESEAGYHGIKQ